jgi:hypothetical protein
MNTFKIIKTFPKYEIDINGQVRNIKTNKIIKSRLHKKNGYYQISLLKDKKLITIYIHRLLAETFIPNPNNLPQVDHIDRNRLNNDINNLRWTSLKDNLKNRKYNSKNLTLISVDNKFIVNYSERNIYKEFTKMEEAIEYFKTIAS